MRNVLALLLAGVLLAPVASAETLTREQFSLERLADAKVIYLDFWASWCGPCRKSFPWLNEMQARYGDQGLVVVGVNLDPKWEDAERFLEKWPANFLLVKDPAGEMADQWRLQGMPSAVLVDRSGRELHRHIGFREDRTDEYEQLLQQLLQGVTQ